MTRAALTAIAAIAALAAAAPANGQVTLGIHSCIVSATPVVFGEVAPPIASSSTGTITLTCTGAGRNNPFSVALSTGLGGYRIRTMRQGSFSLAYNLYLDAARTQVWGDGSAGSQVAEGVIDFVNLVGRDNGTETVPLTVFAQLPSQGAPPNGPYADLIVVTVSF